MLSVQPGSLDGGDEELGAVGVLAGVGHAQPALAVVLQLEVLVREAVSVDALTLNTGSRGIFVSVVQNQA